MIGVFRLSSMQQLAMHMSDASFTQLLMPSEHILHNALLKVILKLCECGFVVQTWSRLSQLLPLLPPEQEQGGSRGSAAPQVEVNGALDTGCAGWGRQG